MLLSTHRLSMSHLFNLLLLSITMINTRTQITTTAAITTYMKGLFLKNRIRLKCNIFE